MSDNTNAILKLFQAGLTREDFVKRYNELEENGELDLASVFAVNEDISAEDVFDTINKYSSDPNSDTDNVLDENDINSLAQKFQEDSVDGKAVLSENDIAIMYHEIYAQKNPEDIQAKSYNKIKNDNIFGFTSDSEIDSNAQLLHFRYLQHQIDEVEQKIENTKKKSNEKIKIYNSRIDDEILKNNGLEKKFKIEYKELVEKKEQIEAEIQQKQEKLSNLSENENPETLENQIALLNADLKSVTSQIKSKRNNVSNEKINSYQTQIRQEKIACSNKIMQYEMIKNSIIQVQNIALSKLSYVSQDADKSTNNTDVKIKTDNTQTQNNNVVVSHDAEKLTQAWNSNKGLNLSKQFVQKTIDVAKNIGADANDLLALMYSESRISSSIQNRAGATGLIQFMPATARALGTTTDALKNMSPEQQLDYVQKYFEQNKKVAGITGNLSAGDLYALTFLPGRAGRETLTSRGERYYSANAGLDRNKDGSITKQDLTNRIKSYIPESAKNV